ncbi:MAG: hypothetical protein LBE03_01805 [Candidatus Nomurabacteria bacterium]|jgi:uncharacterized protein YukE|nr:hypothetical protein [Candidatus Nomurabacteria bacterium]
MIDRRKRKVAVVVTITMFLVASFVATQIDYQDLSDRIASSRFEPSAEIVTLGNQLDLTEKGQRVLYASSPVIAGRETFNDNCTNGGDEHVNVLGCYHDKKIFVFAIDNEQVAGIKEVTLAHELLHAVWSRLGQSERAKLGELLNHVYSMNEKLADKIQYYDVSERDNELHSIIGTEVRDLPDELERHYAKYFKNRASIVATYDGYSEVFDALKRESEELSEQMRVLEQAVFDLKTEYEERWDTLSAEITDFNQRANTGAFVSESAFRSERAVLEQKTNELNNLYTTINQKIDEYNGLVEKYNAVSVHLTELANSISSTAPPVEF